MRTKAWTTTPFVVDSLCQRSGGGFFLQSDPSTNLQKVPDWSWNIDQQKYPWHPVAIWLRSIGEVWEVTTWIPKETDLETTVFWRIWRQHSFGRRVFQRETLLSSSLLPQASRHQGPSPRCVSCDPPQEAETNSPKEYWARSRSTRNNMAHMGVSWNKGTPKSSILMGFSSINHHFWDTPMTMEPPICFPFP